MSEGVGECRHPSEVDGCLSCCERETKNPDRPARTADLDARIDRQNRFAASIGPPPTCAEHGRTPCDVCGASYQPIL